MRRDKDSSDKRDYVDRTADFHLHDEKQGKYISLSHCVMYGQHANQASAILILTHSCSQFVLLHTIAITGRLS